MVENFSIANAATLRQMAGFEQSPATYAAFDSFNSATNDLSASSLRALRTTFAPCETMALAVSSPIPDVAPLITTTLPFKSWSS